MRRKQRTELTLTVTEATTPNPDLGRMLQVFADAERRYDRPRWLRFIRRVLGYWQP